MAISDRIAVMKGGVIQHIGTPKNIYQRPSNSFVASFIGRSNMLRGKLRMAGGEPHLLVEGLDVVVGHVKQEMRKDQDVLISVRPEDLLMGGETAMKGVIDDGVFLGLDTHYFMHLPDGQEVISIGVSSIENTIPKGEQVSLSVNVSKINIFTSDGSANILEGVRNDNVTE